MTITIRGIEMCLLPQKAVYLPQQERLIIADMHLGKLVHFRSKGVFVPIPHVNEDLENLTTLLNEYRPSEVVFLGDLFHSDLNHGFSDFLRVITRFPAISFKLTKGNHDILPKACYRNARLCIKEDEYQTNGLVFRHSMPGVSQPALFYLVGHVHPGYIIQGKGRQRYRLPCFHLHKNVLTLPAFGKHTGLYIPQFHSDDEIYIIMNGEVVALNSSQSDAVST